MVEDPGTLMVTCDGCGKQVPMDTTQYAGGLPTFGVDEQTIEDLDWMVDGEETFCPECSEELEKEE